MKYIVETVAIEDEAIYLYDPDRENPIKVATTIDGEDLVLSVAGTGKYIVVDTKIFIGALRALKTKDERDRLNSREKI